jgi:hypothetical protein
LPQYSHTPILHVAGFEDEDDDEESLPRRRLGEGGTTILLPMVDLFADGETRRPIELVAFGMSTNQGVGAQLKEVAAILKSEFSNHAFEPL